MLDYADIIQIADGLDQDFTRLREDAKGRYELYSLRREPYVAGDIAREGKFRLLSPLLINAAQSIRSDIMMNPTEFTVVPLAREKDGSITRKSEGMAENLERSLAVIWSKLNEGRAIDYDVIWHQLVSPYAVIILEIHDFVTPDQPENMSDEEYVSLVENAQREWMPWSLYLPDPMTCSWIEKKGKPSIFARRYKMLVRDVEDQYSQNKGSVAPDHYFRLGTDNRFGWYSDDYERTGSEVKAGFQEVECIWLDDGKNIYHVVQNPAATGSGEVVWCAPNPTGKLTAFVVPGNTTPSRKIEDRYEPFLLPLMQVVMQLNDLRSTRATAARNLAGPHTYVSIDPEVAKLYIAKGEPLPTSVRWKKGETSYLLGKVETMPSELSTDWDKIEHSVDQELQRYLPSPFVHIVDPAVLKAATATSILHAAESGLRVYGPLMSAYDSVIRDIMDSIVRSVRTHYTDLDMTVYATGEEMAHGKNLSQGASYKFDAKSVDFPFRILVRTRGMSQAQAAAQYDLMLRQWILPDGSKGPATIDDVIDAANYTDRVAQKMKLAKESILTSLDPWLQQMAMQASVDRIRLDSGIVLPIGAGQPSGGPNDGKQQPANIPGGAQRMDSPMINPMEGGSEAVPTGPI